MGQRTAHITAGVAILQTPGEHLVKSCSRYDAELTDTGDRLCQAPIGDADAHAALNNFGKRNLHNRPYKGVKL